MFYLAQVTRPVPFPCFGVLHKEKHVLLHSVADVVVEQGAVFAAFFCFFHLSFWTTLFFFFFNCTFGPQLDADIWGLNWRN